MNKLITFISELKNPDAKETVYKIKGTENTVIGYTASEPVIRYLADTEKYGKKIDEIIAVVSHNVKNTEVKFGEKTTTSLNYIKSIASEYGVKFRELNSSYNEETKKDNYDNMIEKICNNISDDDIVYIDTTGGFRNISNMFQILTKILKYKGITHKESYYANYQEKTIETTDEFDTLAELADGVNEFVTTGKSIQLKKYFEGIENPELEKLFKAMQKFTDNIQLCYIDNIDECLSELKKAIVEFMSEDTNSTDTRIVILRQLIPVITEKFFGEGNVNDDGVDYCRLVEWCLDNGLIQQALTIFTEKMALELKRRNIMIYSSERFEEVKNNRKSPFSDIDSEIFYSKMMDEINENSNQVYFFNRYLDNKYKSFEDIPKKYSKYMNRYIKFEKLFKNEIKNHNTDAIKKMKYNSDRDVANIARIFKDNPIITDYNDFVDKLKNNTYLKCRILGIEYKYYKEKGKTCAKKLDTIQKYESGDTYRVEGFESKVTNKQLAQIMYGYLYVKQTRNRINHASDSENFTEEQKHLLETKGYKDEISYETISENIRKALDAIKSVE